MGEARREIGHSNLDDRFNAAGEKVKLASVGVDFAAWMLRQPSLQSTSSPGECFDGFEQPRTPLKWAEPSVGTSRVVENADETPPKVLEPSGGPPAGAVLQQEAKMSEAKCNPPAEARRNFAIARRLRTSELGSGMHPPAAQGTTQVPPANDRLNDPSFLNWLIPAAGRRSVEPCQAEGTPTVPTPPSCEDPSVSSRRLDESVVEKWPAAARKALYFIRAVPTFPDTPYAAPVIPPTSNSAPPWTLVLDLDETLVHCRRMNHKSTAPSGVPEMKVVLEENSQTASRVCFRPFVQYFLEVVARSFDIVVFTASQQAYADKVIDALDPHGRMIKHRLYRQHCTERHGAYFKELGPLGRPLSHCILVDNSPISLACNADNGILIKSWYGESSDEELLQLLGVLQELRRSPGGDCRTYLSGRYGLRRLFASLRAK
jgi:CTD small phosphatase-like protein 2